MKLYERIKVSRLFFIALLATMTYFLARSLFKPIRKPVKKPIYKKSEIEPATEMVQDSVCGIFIDPKKARICEINETLYYFCSEQCEREFMKRLEKEKKI